jgi:hypothetical protein
MLSDASGYPGPKQKPYSRTLDDMADRGDVVGVRHPTPGLEIPQRRESNPRLGSQFALR